MVLEHLLEHSKDRGLETFGRWVFDSMKTRDRTGFAGFAAMVRVDVMALNVNHTGIILVFVRRDLR